MTEYEIEALIKHHGEILTRGRHFSVDIESWREFALRVINTCDRLNDLAAQLHVTANATKEGR